MQKRAKEGNFPIGGKVIINSIEKANKWADPVETLS